MSLGLDYQRGEAAQGNGRNVIAQSPCAKSKQALAMTPPFGH